MLEFLNNNWLTIVVIVLMILQRQYVKGIIDDVIRGTDGHVDFKEFTGFICAVALMVMLVKHIKDNTYIPNESLLYMFSGIVVSIAGIKSIGKDGIFNNKNKEDGK